MRYTFIKTLTEEAKKNKDIMLLTGDLGFTVFEDFREKYPDRFINVGVAEQNLMGIAAGLALSGKTVFAYSIATFVTMRPFEQIRNDIAIHNLSVVVVGTGAGLSYGDAATTHHAIEDISLMRSIPGMTILCPADPTEAEWATRAAILLKKPTYLRLGKKGEPILYTKKPKLILGKGSVLNKGNDLAILATGNIVENALAAARLLARRAINCLVVSIHTVKPIDVKLIKSLSKRFPLIVTIEEHNIIGGLGSAVAEIISESISPVKLLRIGIPDMFFSKTGSQAYLRDLIGLNPNAISDRIYTHFKKK